MSKAVFTYLNKNEKAQWLPRLFDILYTNMRVIAPSGETYEQEKTEWLANVSPALDKEPRQIILFHVGKDLAGYFQYYICDGILMVEEIQLKKDYQRTSMLYRFYKYLIDILPTEIKYIEAYVDKRNLNSQRIMQKLGMEPVKEGTEQRFLHFRGLVENVLQIFRRS